MRVKVFQGFAEGGVQRLEDKINDWLSGEGSAVRVIRADMAAASVGPVEDRFQTVIAMVWYEVSA